MKKLFAGHRALPDAIKLKRLFTESLLSGLLGSMPVKPWEKQLEDYRMTREVKAVQSAYDIKPEQAKTLIKRGLSKEILEELYKTAGTRSKFEMDLHAKGVRSKPLREKLARHLSTATNVFV
jgi:hypothetical protein